MAKPLLFDRDTEKVVRFIIVCKLYIKMRMRKEIVEKQVQWILIYIQKESVDIWKKNILKNLKSEV